MCTRAYDLNKCIMMSLRCPPRPQVYVSWLFVAAFLSSNCFGSRKIRDIHLIHKWRNARKSLGRVHESEAKGASDSNENKAEYGNASSISCNS